MPKVNTFKENNVKIKSDDAVVLTAEEVSKMVKEISPEELVEKVIKQAENFPEIKSLLIICEDKIGKKEKMRFAF